MRIAQVSDFHYTYLTWNPFRLFSKRILGNLNWLSLRKKHFFEEQLESLPGLFQELGVDLVLLGGDFSTTGLIEEFEKAKQFVDKIKQPWIAIPGNHDHYTRRSYRKKHFYRYFTNQQKTGHPAEQFTLKDHGIEAHPLRDEWWLIALDTALATHLYSSEGFLSEKLESHLEKILKLLPASASILLLNHYPFFQNDVQRHNLIRGEALQALLMRHPRIRLYLHGHTHRQIIADLQVSGLPIILDSGSCAQGAGGAWNLIDLKAEGCSVTLYRWNQKWIEIGTEKFVWARR